VFDLIEPFRVPAVDKPLFGWLNRGTKLSPNKDGMLRTATRVQIATLVSEAIARPTPWGGEERPLAAHLEDHAVRLRDWLQGGPPLQALRIRW
jgi:CRISPR/Cas system-associated endonuclease Cas1